MFSQRTYSLMCSQSQSVCKAILNPIITTSTTVNNRLLLTTSGLSVSKMPKKGGGKGAGGGKDSASTKGGAASTPAIKSPVVVGKDGNILISIQVKPGSKVDAITDVTESAVGVQISAPPVDGEANTAIVKYFAELLKIKKADVTLKGGKSKQKTISVSSSAGLTSDGIITLLKTEAQQR